MSVNLPNRCVGEAVLVWSCTASGWARGHVTRPVREAHDTVEFTLFGTTHEPLICRKHTRPNSSYVQEPSHMCCKCISEPGFLHNECQFTVPEKYAKKARNADFLASKAVARDGGQKSRLGLQLIDTAVRRLETRGCSNHHIPGYDGKRAFDIVTNDELRLHHLDSETGENINWLQEYRQYAAMTRYGVLVIAHCEESFFHWLVSGACQRESAEVPEGRLWVLYNDGEQDVITDLSQALSSYLGTTFMSKWFENLLDEHHLVREPIAKALQTLGARGPHARQFALELLALDRPGTAAALSLVSVRGDSTAVDALLALLRQIDDDFETSRKALEQHEKDRDEKFWELLTQRSSENPADGFVDCRDFASKMAKSECPTPPYEDRTLHVVTKQEILKSLGRLGDHGNLQVIEAILSEVEHSASHINGLRGWQALVMESYVQASSCEALRCFLEAHVLPMQQHDRALPAIIALFRRRHNGEHPPDGAVVMQALKPLALLGFGSPLALNALADLLDLGEGNHGSWNCDLIDAKWYCQTSVDSSYNVVEDAIVDAFVELSPGGSLLSFEIIARLRFHQDVTVRKKVLDVFEKLSSKSENCHCLPSFDGRVCGVWSCTAYDNPDLELFSIGEMEGGDLHFQMPCRQDVGDVLDCTLEDTGDGWFQGQLFSIIGNSHGAVRVRSVETSSPCSLSLGICFRSATSDHWDQPLCAKPWSVTLMFAHSLVLVDQEDFIIRRAREGLSRLLSPIIGSNAWTLAEVAVPIFKELAEALCKPGARYAAQKRQIFRDTCSQGLRELVILLGSDRVVDLIQCLEVPDLGRERLLCEMKNLMISANVFWAGDSSDSS